MPGARRRAICAGETRKYEDNVVDVLIENVRRLQRGEDALVNRIA